MYKHKATMTERRREILILLAKGYNNRQIAKKMDLSLSNAKMQKWRLYCYLCVNKAIDAVYAGLQMGLIPEYILSEPIREELCGYGKEDAEQVFSQPERERYKCLHV